MPHITELQKKYQDKVTFVGVNVWEEQNPTDDSYLAKVEKYVSDFGDKMGYIVAADDKEGTIAKTWMAASESNGIPQSFIVGGDGKILWMGHPMMLDKTLEQIVGGTYDLAAATKADATRRSSAKAEREAIAPIRDAFTAKDYKRAVQEIDKAIAKKPELEKNFAMPRFQALLMSDEPAAYAYARKLSETTYKDNANALNSLAWTLVDDAIPIKLKKPDYGLAVTMAERAVKLTGEKDAYTLDTLAYALFKNGKIDKAIDVQSKALKIAESTPDFNAATLKEIRDRLDLMKSKKAAKNKS